LPLTTAPIDSERWTVVGATVDQVSVVPGAASLSVMVTVAGWEVPTV
jgi:hypothetical protein